MIVLDKITKKLGVRVLFENVSVTFNSKARYGLTGPNGSGKSTLLKIMMGQEDPTSGSLSLPKKVGFLKQNISEFKNRKTVDTVIMGNHRLWKALEERDLLYEGEMTEEVGLRLGKLEEIVAEENGYTAEAEAETLLHGMGIPSDCYSKPMHTIPLDMQFKVLLCQALFGNPEALLLDEPTNHLDLDSIRWLEEFLHNYEGSLIVVSHDRHFLNTVCTHIADIDYETIIIYPGNYDAMITTKSDIRARTEADNKSKEKKISELKEFVSKFGAGTRASQVQSRLREIDKLQPQELKKSNIQRPYIRFKPIQTPSGQMVFQIKHLSKSFDHPVIQHFTCEIHKGDRIGVIGNNGRGKTTLLRMLAGVLTPDHGEVTFGHNVKIGYFAQNHSEIIDKSLPLNTIQWLKKQRPEVHEQDIRSALGKLLFSGDEALKEIHKLSGGETARLILASLILNDVNTLLLDEPNNHLDLESVSALGSGLNEFKGTILLASHDRDLINTVATKLFVLEQDGIHIFEGNLEEYIARHALT